MSPLSDLSASKGLPGLLSPEAELDRIAADLADRFQGAFAPQTVERYVYESYASLARSVKVTAHLPVLTAAFARDRLTALAQSQGFEPNDVRRCCSSACRTPAARRSPPPC